MPGAAAVLRADQRGGVAEVDDGSGAPVGHGAFEFAQDLPQAGTVFLDEVPAKEGTDDRVGVHDGDGVLRVPGCGCVPERDGASLRRVVAAGPDAAVQHLRQTVPEIPIRMVTVVRLAPQVGRVAQDERDVGAVGAGVAVDQLAQLRVRSLRRQVPQARRRSTGRCSTCPE